MGGNRPMRKQSLATVFHFSDEHHVWPQSPQTKGTDKQAVSSSTKHLATQRGPWEALKVLDSYPGLLPPYCQTLELKLGVGNSLGPWFEHENSLDAAWTKPSLPCSVRNGSQLGSGMGSEHLLAELRSTGAGHWITFPSQTFSSKGPTSATQNLPSSSCWDSWTCHQSLVQCPCARGHCISPTQPACLCFRNVQPSSSEDAAHQFPSIQAQAAPVIRQTRATSGVQPDTCDSRACSTFAHPYTSSGKLDLSEHCFKFLAVNGLTNRQCYQSAVLVLIPLTLCRKAVWREAGAGSCDCCPSLWGCGQAPAGAHPQQ